ncbi:hypothetical protein C8R46DRAFT_1220734 [Mycena filopes]|nr:hypothetical protein C8R46DRAFT_1220734 [Mycena filopes]
MKATGVRRRDRAAPSPVARRVATNVETYQVTYDRGSSSRTTQSHYVPITPESRDVPNADLPRNIPVDEPMPLEPFLPFQEFPDETPGAVPAYEATAPSPEATKKTRQAVAHMQELRDKEEDFLRILLSLHYHVQLNTPCTCGSGRQRVVACTECMQSELLCRQCWVNKHRTMPTHWAFVWNKHDRFFEKHDFCRVKKNVVIALGHYGEVCPDAELGQSFTLVDTNGIHATCVAFCRCETADEKRGKPEFEQLTEAGIFPGSLTTPKTGYTLGLLRYHRKQRSQGKGSAYNFVLVLQRMADPFFATTAVPDIYANFLAISRFYESLEILLESGQAHGLDVPLPGEVDVPYPNRPQGFTGAVCAACPERGVNMPMVVNVPRYLRHTIAHHVTLDGNFKANLFFKRDDGSDISLTDGKMYFPKQSEFDHIAATYVIPVEDTEVPCKNHIGSIRHQGHTKFGNTAISGVVACACDHSVLGSLVDMPKGEAFAIVVYALRELLRHIYSLMQKESRGPLTISYDSWCSFVINLLKRARELFPEEEWLEAMLADSEGQIPADHINGHGKICQVIWQAVYFACRAHFHGETAEQIWAFLNPLGLSTRQMTGAARHDIINFVMHAWNVLKYLRHAERLAAERLDALRLFELHMAVVMHLSRQHPEDVGAWSRMSRLSSKSASGEPQSVYQHEGTEVLSVETVLASLVMAEQERLKQQEGHDAGTPVAQWVHDGMVIDREQRLTIALVKNHREHALQETWDTITRMRDTLNIKLKKFREQQRAIYPHVKLSGLDPNEPEVTAIQLPSYRARHGHRAVTAHDLQLRDAEIQLRSTAAELGILAVQDASLALSAVKKACDFDYRGQAGKTRSERNLQKAVLMKDFEITMYNTARAALIDLGHMAKDNVESFPPLSTRDTRRKETHLHRAKGNSRVFDGTAWYLQSGTTISQAALASKLPSVRGDQDSDEDEPRLLAGTKTLKRAGCKRGQRSPKRFKDIMPEVESESAASSSEAEDGAPPAKSSKPAKGKGKVKVKKPDGWIWLRDLTRGRAQSGEKLAAYKRESDRVQWFRAEAEMYRWLEQYERKHAKFMRIIARYERDAAVWAGLAAVEEERNQGVNGAATFARMQAAMHRRLEHNARVAFKDADSGAHHDWVCASTFDELVVKIDAWRDVVFKWMDDMGIHRAYKDF